MASDHPTAAVPNNSNAAQLLPLVVDLDGTLLRTNLLHEAFFDRVANRPSHYIGAGAALLRGRAALDRYLSDSSIDCANLPYDEDALRLIETAKAEGRRVFLATEVDRKYANAIAEHLGLFDGVLASDDTSTASGSAKGERLRREFGEKGFDYAGNSLADLPVWRMSARSYALGVSPSVERQLSEGSSDVIILSRRPPKLMSWLKAFRLHQWVKNVLIFVPVLTSHSFRIESLLLAFSAFLAFSLCASAVYLLNDLTDLRSDRAHPTKKMRPFAMGSIPLAGGFVAIPLLLGLATLIGFAVSPQFLSVLAVYFALTTAYSLVLKRKMLVDVIALAILYTLRIVAGAVAIGVDLSHWLAMFSFFFFTGLALIKRHTELSTRQHAGLPNPSNRDYAIEDLPIIGALAAAAGLNAVTIFALYISSDAVAALYRRPEALWLIAPLLLYWFARCLILTHRRMMDDDPVVFALHDRVSLLTLGAIVAIVLVAI